MIACDVTNVRNLEFEPIRSKRKAECLESINNQTSPVSGILKSLKTEGEKSPKKLMRAVSWETTDDGSVKVEYKEIPSKEDLEISEIWHDTKQLGFEALKQRNNLEELKEFSESMLSLDCLSPENRERYSMEALTAPTVVDQSGFYESQDTDFDSGVEF